LFITITTQAIPNDDTSSAYRYPSACCD
jgi:hypothetical protein